MEGKEMGTTVLRHFGVKAGWVIARERHGGPGKFIDQRWRDLSTFKDYWGGLLVRRECRQKTRLPEGGKGWAVEQRSWGRAGTQALVRRVHFLRAERRLELVIGSEGCQRKVAWVFIHGGPQQRRVP